MDGKNKKKKGRKPKNQLYYLPPELWTDHIFPTLPVKTLCVFRSVCKSWCSAIDDPRFVSKHYKLSKNNSDKKLVLTIEKWGRNEGGRRLTVRRRDTMGKVDHLLDTDEPYDFLMSCNGLFLVCIFKQPAGQQLELWNPSIRKSLLLPHCPVLTGSPRCIVGFRSSSNDYVVCAFSKDNDHSWAVYTLSDNLWRIKGNDYYVPSWRFGRYLHGRNGHQYVSLDEKIYWFGYDARSVAFYLADVTHLVSFNFETENFRHVELPHACKLLDPGAYKSLAVLGGLVAVFIISSIRTHIWVLRRDGAVNLWNLWFSRESGGIGFKYIRNHRHVLTKFIYIEDGSIILVYGRVAYNLSTDEIHPLVKSLCCRLILDTYLETMVLHKGVEGQVLTSLLPQ